MHIITVNKISVEVEWKPIKNIHLTVYPPDARIHISAPEQMTEDAVRLFIITKLEWIGKRVELIRNQSRQTEREYVSGENHYYKGIRYRLKVIYHEAAPKVELQGRQFINLYVRNGATVEKKAEVLREWYREELKQTLGPLVERWETLLEVKATHWEVKQMKTLWGSCNHSTKRIIFNLELIKKPSQCIEYIVAHELTHLVERLHNARFTTLLDNYLPTWRQIKHELNEFVV
ncbi:MAG: M48 family metallopeptidase [Dysgonamonadaceae bacterium]|jgi:predicted metal-dependent hydrolase|nr:M48 family metallopeptidase [Dysgonamonadaceae bacterium]